MYSDCSTRKITTYSRSKIAKKWFSDWNISLALTLTCPCVILCCKLLKELLHTSCLVYTLTQPSPGPPTLSISSKGLYFIKQLKRAGLPIVTYFIFISQLYGRYLNIVCQSLRKVQSERLEAVQKPLSILHTTWPMECRIHSCCFK